MDQDKNIIVSSKTLKYCVYIPPFMTVFHWLGASSPATMLKNFCLEDGITSPPVSFNSINKIMGFNPGESPSRKTKDRLYNWVGEIFPDQVNEINSSPHLAQEGVIGFGALSWLGAWPHLERKYGHDFPYLLQVLDGLIKEEKRIVTDVFSRDLSPGERFRVIYKNDAVKGIYERAKIEFSSQYGSRSIAIGDKKTNGYLRALPMLYILAAADAEYSQDSYFIEPNFGLMQVVLPEKYEKGSLHRAYWERMRAHAGKHLKEKAKWSHLESHFAGDEDNARKTLNRYKSGSVKISDEGLTSLAQSIWGDDSEYLIEAVRVRYKAIIFLSNMFEQLLDKNDKYQMKIKDISFLIGKYREFYDFHYSVLAAAAKD